MKKLIVLIVILFVTNMGNGQAIIGNPQNSGLEGGELVLLNGNSSYNQWNIDNYGGDFRFFHSGVVHFITKSNGNVGIGTTNPTEKFHVNGTVKVGNGDWGALIIDGKDDNDWLFNAHNSGTTLAFRTQQDGGIPWSHQIMTLDRISGNVGIGTINPTEKLHVNGNFLLDAFNLGAEKGLFFRQGFSSSNKYNLSILTYDDGDGFADGLGINAYDGIYFNTGSNSKNTRMFIHQNGKVGNGTTSPDSKLTVKGKIHAEEVKVDLSVPGPDYVFANDYILPTLEALQNYIQKNKHLPNIPSAKEMEANGIELGIMNMKLLEKIEELTFYTLEQEEKIKELEKQKERNQKLEARLLKIEQLLMNKRN